MRSLLLASFTALLAAQAPVPNRSWEKAIAPGISYRMEWVQPSPLVIHALRWSPAQGGEMKAALGGTTVFATAALPARESVSSMSARSDALAGVNGDFFPSSGDPLGLMMMEGELISRPWPGRSAAAWSPSGMVMGRAAFRGEAQGPRGFQMAIEGLNEEAVEERLVLNRPLAGEALLRAPGHHAIIELSGTLEPGKAIRGKVLRLSGEQKLALASNESALSGSGKAAEAIKTLRPGDEVAVSVSIDGLALDGMREAIAGGPALVRGGKEVSENELEGFRKGFDTERHPRTALGRTAKGEVWLVVVDGRQPRVSRGATLSELAQIMLRLGCEEAINLDGGGSSEMVAQGLTVNRPSDGQPRPVANGLLLFGSRGAPSEGAMVIQGKTYVSKDLFSRYRILDSKGDEVPAEEVVWSSEGPAWIDQGGFLRWLAPGQVKVKAFVRGRLLEVPVTAEPPESVASPSPAPPR